MSKRPNEPTRRPVRLKLPQISVQELKTIKVSIRRKDVPGGIVAGPLVRSLENPEELVLHKPGEGEKPIFDRDDIVVNLDFDERVVITASESPKPYSISKSEERQVGHSRNRRSHSRKTSPERKYLGRSRSRSNDEMPHQSSSSFADHPKSNVSINYYKNVEESRRYKDNYDDKAASSSGLKSRHRSLSKERHRSSSRDRQHSKYRRSPPQPDSYRSSHYETGRKLHRTPSPRKYDYAYRKYSRSPSRRPESSRRSRSPYRDSDSKYRDYRKRSQPPRSRERYKSPTRTERREYSRSPPKYRGPPDDERRHKPLHYQMPPHFGGPWPVYDPMSSYVRFMIPEGFIQAPLPRFPTSVPMRPRMPSRPLPIYNNRPIPKIRDIEINPSTSTTNVSASADNANCADIASTSKDNSDSLPVVTTTQQIVKTTDSHK